MYWKTTRQTYRYDFPSAQFKKGKSLLIVNTSHIMSSNTNNECVLKILMVTWHRFDGEFYQNNGIKCALTIGVEIVHLPQ